MDAVELTKLFVEYKETSNRLALLEKAIEKEVLELQQSQTIAGVKATYYSPSKEYDYEDAASGHPMVSDATLNLFTTITKRIRWKEICEHIGLTEEEIPSTEKPARVVIKA